ncbi:mannose-6-phosphate isomerase, class I [Aeromicrobium marinum DSM 15272]|uniref:mannose-6-phosphate isomerase n=1 Tax=Aeromicrobium marinum DSM 15272 TaxID=585531 RepID=E2SEW6_9ACTN|nr:mannose-6-phosphate isomerase, class I [Aeromicrobium marinum]EFQ82413.1 mannose-6-phosphate isomerase, class I [Aeromicrobium marinum DSM 15272]
MHRLFNASRDYDWGSTLDIARFLGEQPDGRPLAELWMGTHELSPSEVQVDGERVSLGKIAGDLPFMMKVLAADRPLSLQVHPNMQLARSGFAAEDEAGIPLDAPNRSYKDPRHKPEMAYALTTFDTLVGFRPTAEILRVLDALDAPLTRRLADDLRAAPGFEGIVRIIQQLLAGPVAPAEVQTVVAACRDLVDRHVDVKRAYATAVEIAEFFPEDVGVVISLLLNRLTLQPGEAAFLGAGIIHAHLRGMCLEVMTSSDNVLRAGLTSKHVDPEGLVTCLERGMSRLARITPDIVGTETEIFAPDVEEFALAVTQVSRADDDGVPLVASGHRIVLCTGGEVELFCSEERVSLVRGDSVYLAPEDGPVRAYGTGEVAQAFTPTGDLDSRLVDLV